MTPETAECDWCGEPFAGEEQPVPGYENMPTHRKCQREAVTWWRKQMGEEPDRPEEREPFVDWPNGQGTYD